MLPKQTLPKYPVTIPSTKVQVNFSPFTVKEQRSLLIAQQSEEPEVMAETVLSVLDACLQGKVDVTKLATFDIEYLFLQIRAKSVGEIAELIFSCDVCTDEKAKIKIQFDLTKLKVEFSPEHTSKIDLFDDVGVMMKYPTYKTLLMIEQSEDDSKLESDLVMECIEYIYKANEVFQKDDYTNEELVEFLDGLTDSNFRKLYKFFDTLPELHQKVKFTCPVCGLVHNKHLQGIEYFF